MKKILFILFVFPLFAKSQAVLLPIDANTKKVTFTEVVNIDGVSKEDLYKRAVEWFHRFYENPDDVIKRKDVITNTIVGNGVYEITGKLFFMPVTEKVRYQVTVICKDGRYKYELTNFVILPNAAAPASARNDVYELEMWNTESKINKKGEWKDSAKFLIPGTQTNVDRIANSIKDAMSGKSMPGAKKDDF